MSKLYPCVYCTDDGYCKKYSDDEVTSWCVQSPCKDEKPSNADRIRAMTDEELADRIMGFVRCEACEREFHIECNPFMTCRGVWLEWLKSPVEVDNG